GPTVRPCFRASVMNYPLLFEVGVGLVEVQLFDPAVAVADVVAFGLELEAAGGVGDALATVVAAVDAAAGPAPDLADGEIAVDLLAVEVHGKHRLLGALAVGEARGAEGDVVGVHLPTP